MKRDLIIAESRRDDFGFITTIAQRGKNRPKKFKHDITMPIYLYEELRNKGIISPENYFIDESAFFEFSLSEVTISFLNLYAAEDLNTKSLIYLVKKFAGSCPIKRGG